MITMDHQLRLYLEGPDIPDPAHLGLGELAKLLEKLNRAIVTFAEESKAIAGGEFEGESPQLASLVSIQTGSVGLTIQHSPLLAVEHRLIEPVLENRWDLLPPKSHAQLYELSKELLAKDRSLKVLLSSMNAPVPWIGAERPVPKRRAKVMIEDTITLYGQVIRLGGVTPKIDVRAGGEEYHVETDPEVVKDLEKRGVLYKVIGIKVAARLNLEGQTWSVDSRSLRLVEVLPYVETNAAEAFRRLAKLTGEYWREVDVDDYMKKIRG